MRICRPTIITLVVRGVAFACLACGQSVQATSGWDSHDQVIAGTIRIHGANGASVVERRDGDGQFGGPPLLDSLIYQHLHGPPDYAQTDDQVLLRYQWHGPRSEPRHQWPVHFVVPVEQGNASGPFSITEVQQLLGLRYETLNWTSPDLPAAWPLMGVVLFAMYWPWLLLGGMLLGLAYWAWERLLIRRTSNNVREIMRTANDSFVGFLADGHERACQAVRETIMRDYADRLESATAAERVRLQQQMEQEIERQIRTQAPPDALY